MRASYNGITLASQARDEGSTPFARSKKLQKLLSRNGNGTERGLGDQTRRLNRQGDRGRITGPAGARVEASQAAYEGSIPFTRSRPLSVPMIPARRRGSSFPRREMLP